MKILYEIQKFFFNLMQLHICVGTIVVIIICNARLETLACLLLPSKTISVDWLIDHAKLDLKVSFFLIRICT